MRGHYCSPHIRSMRQLQLHVVVNMSYKTHALLNSGSTNSFITSDAVKSFGLSSKTVIYKHSTVDTPCMTTSKLSCKFYFVFIRW